VAAAFAAAALAAALAGHGWSVPRFLLPPDFLYRVTQRLRSHRSAGGLKIGLRAWAAAGPGAVPARLVGAREQVEFSAQRETV
jgi:hypothetical protein